jgi:hypothetical protein
MPVTSERTGAPPYAEWQASTGELPAPDRGQPRAILKAAGQSWAKLSERHFEGIPELAQGNTAAAPRILGETFSDLEASDLQKSILSRWLASGQDDQVSRYTAIAS